VLANIPAAQTVIEIKSAGGPEMLVSATRPVPEPKAGEVLIRIAAAEVNRADCLQRMGRYPTPTGASDIPGLECSGTVVKTGEGVSQWQVGNQLCALMVADGYSEYSAVPAVQCLPVPQGVSLVDADGLPETFSTVWADVFERMQLRSGEVFLVQVARAASALPRFNSRKPSARRCWPLQERMRNAVPLSIAGPMSRSTPHPGFPAGWEGIHHGPRCRRDSRHGRR